MLYPWQEQDETDEESTMEAPGRRQLLAEHAFGKLCKEMIDELQSMKITTTCYINAKKADWEMRSSVNALFSVLAHEFINPAWIPVFDFMLPREPNADKLYWICQTFDKVLLQNLLHIFTREFLKLRGIEETETES